MVVKEYQIDPFQVSYAKKRNVIIKEMWSCPCCGSGDVRLDWGEDYEGNRFVEEWACNNCKSEGPSTGNFLRWVVKHYDGSEAIFEEGECYKKGALN